MNDFNPPLPFPHVPLHRTNPHLYTNHPSPPDPNPQPTSKARISIRKQLHKIRLKPRSRLGSRLQCITIRTMGIVSRTTRITRAIALTPRLNPHESIFDGRARIRSRSNPKPGPDDIAPVSPGILLGGLDAVARRVSDEVSRVSDGREEGSESRHVEELVVVWIAGGV